MEDGLQHSLSSINTATQEPKPNCSSEAFKAHQDQQSLSLGPDDECDSSDKDVYPHATQNQLEFQVGNEAASNQGPAPDGEQDEPTQGSVDTDPNLSANQCEAEESDGSVPELVVTEAEESRRPAATLQRSERPPALVIPAAISITTLGSSADGGDMNCCDLLSPRSDSFSLTVSRRSEEDDTRSVAASSIMSLFHRVHMDPLEKDWLRSSARGNMTAQRLLLAQEPSLILKKDFINSGGVVDEAGVSLDVATGPLSYT
ncbi:uncharacterized protein LOC133444879 [Cololabis saira]|uniref:uncharacterized protein LOC133444879 n=1 Tax=Cololabis saira TaxID=129043 RepID=UPI002AD1D585|nr:uncharacterized protein LOC133444879 [Cololabis saira]